MYFNNEYRMTILSVFFILFLGNCQYPKTEVAELNGPESMASNKKEISMYPFNSNALNKEFKYSAYNLFDGRTDSWCVEREPSGEYKFNSFSIMDSDLNENGKYKIDHLYIVNGFGNPKYWQENNRLKNVEIELWSKETGYVRHRFTLKDSYNNKISFKPFEAKGFSINILSVYPGTKYDDTCIAEISFSPIKHEDLIGSKFKADAQLRDRDFWGREFTSSDDNFQGKLLFTVNLDKDGVIFGDGSGDVWYGGEEKLLPGSSRWYRKNGQIYFELLSHYETMNEQQTGHTPESYNTRYTFSVSEQAIINDADGSYEVPSSSISVQRE